ncbi:LCP family protein [Streptomyces sp. NPDC059009]|uniref:LCP family protein n=1 Tax=Streptomyces sp. NPDC059009 TaxID=3346694 RepID=UPI00367C2A19
MRQGSVRGEDSPPGGSHDGTARGAGEHGWDDGLYGGGSGDDAPAGPSPAGSPSDGAAPDGAAPNGGEPPQAAGRHRHRRGGGGSGKGGGGARPPRRKRRVLRWTATVVAVLILGTAGAGYLYYQYLNGKIQTDDLNLGDHRAPEATPNAAGQTPLNILLIGSDSRNTKENLKLGGSKESVGAPPLADVQMLLHLSADRSNMSVISMPRDTLLDIPKCTDRDDGKVYPAKSLTMTNETLERGGPGCTVATWEKLTDIRIDHFLMVDFSGVVDMADAVGGVPVCVDANIYSHTSKGKGSGLKLTKGTHDIKGKQALQWLRTRYGFDGGTDISRAKAQHMYMNALVRKLRENTGLSSPNKLRNLAETAIDALKVDDGLDSIKKLYDLGNELKKVPPKRTTMTTMPWQYAVSDHDRVEPKPGDAEQLFRLVRDDIALDGKDKKKPKKSAEEKLSDDPAAPDAQIAVQVQNGTRTDAEAPATGRAGEVAQLLVGKGFTRSTSDPTEPEAQEKTVISYPSKELEGDAQRVAKSLGLPLSSVKQSTDVSGVTLTVGADWREGDTPPKAPKKDDKTPSSAEAMNGSDKKQCMHVDPNYTW